MANRIFKYIGDNVKAIPNEERQSTIFRVIGHPYGGPKYLNSKDLQGEFFAKDTDYGRNDNNELLVKTVFAYYDHALRNSMKEAIGSATFVEETDDGLVWDIEVSRKNRYHNMLLALAEKKFLGVSSQPVQTSVEIDADTGFIKRWHTAELSFTPMPANPLAEVVGILKSFDMSDEVVAVYTEFVKDFEETAVDVEEAQEEETPAPVVEEEVNEDSLSNEIDQMFDTPTEPVVSELLTDVKSLLALVTALQVEVKALQDAMAAGNKEVVKQVIVTQNGIKSFASKVAHDVKFKIQKDADEEEQMSEDEKAAQDELKKKHSLPGPKGK